MLKKSLQIDVIGACDVNESLIKCHIYIDGRCCVFYTTSANYHALIYDGIFIRDGKNHDSANVINTTRVFYEEK